MPHRGYELRFQARVALFFGVLSIFTCLPCLVALPLALYVVCAAESDLDKIDGGLMDERGTAETLAAIRIAGKANFCAFVGMFIFGLIAITLFGH
jgi:hypothetical protein